MPTSPTLRNVPHSSHGHRQPDSSPKVTNRPLQKDTPHPAQEVPSTQNRRLHPVKNCLIQPNFAATVAEIFLHVEPLAGRRHVQITERRTRKDWAYRIRDLLDNEYPDAVNIRIVMGNLNTHSTASLYQTFDPAEARRLAERLEIHYTPKHGNWLNIAEIELSALKGQCLNRRIPDIKMMASEVAAWEARREGRATGIDWQFTAADARTKLKHVYPRL